MLVKPSAYDGAILAWLDAKSRRSSSEKTRRAYSDNLTGFRAFLQSFNLDLDAGPGVIAPAAQKWAGLPSAKGRAVTPSTFNHRLACLSSFFEYARKHSMIPGLDFNPIELVERSRVQDYANALPIEPDEITARLSAIDRSTVKGKRDYAILAIGLYTGRRLSELAGLCYGDIDRSTRVITWRHCKGGKVLHDEMPAALWAVYLDYEACLPVMSSDAPLWLSFARNHTSMGVDAIRGICAAYLGTSKSHAIRHTAAKTMESVGMTTSDIQGRLGHTSIQTTGLYLKALSSAHNSHGGALAAALGIAPR